MADFSKRPEVTIETMIRTLGQRGYRAAKSDTGWLKEHGADLGNVHNPSGQGVNAISVEVKKCAAKFSNGSNAPIKLSTTGPDDSKKTTQHQNGHHSVDEHETKVKETGSARRNITRKKSDLYDNKNKKQGGAGKGKWGKALDGSDMLEDASPLDKNDPLYDEQEGKYILSSSNGADEISGDANGFDPIAESAVYGPLLTLAEFKFRVSEAIREYFDSADADEVVRGIQEMKCKAFHAEVVKRAISLSLDEGPRERELTSRLLTCLHPNPLEDVEMETGFEILLNSLEDLSIDIPDAKCMVGSFLARAIVDEVIPPAFISNRNNSHPGDEVVEKAVSLLSREHCTARLEKLWGPGDGRPVTELKEVIDQLIEEYLLSRELDEAARCVREMNAPHFHHELVKRGVRFAMEKDGLDTTESSSSSLDAVAALFSFLVKNAIVSEYQVAKGISRLRKGMTDIKLDVPAAPVMLEEFEKMAREGGCYVKL